jgi:hypothetical protein
MELTHHLDIMFVCRFHKQTCSIYFEYNIWVYLKVISRINLDPYRYDKNISPKKTKFSSIIPLKLSGNYM